MTADGTGWRFFAGGESASSLLSLFKHATGANRESAGANAVREAIVVKSILLSTSKRGIRWRDFPVEQKGEISCQVGPLHTPEKTAFQLIRIANVVAHSCEKNGGLLVHGALAARNGFGVILAGPGGVGKTTASKRIPSPWRSLSDDTSLIAKSPDGTYWAHPWPTWSRLRAGDLSESWDVRAAVRLNAIFMLTQAKKDRVSPVPRRQAISELVDVSGQTFFIMANGMDGRAIHRINLMRFHNAVAISEKIPICRLEISKSGKFWEEIEKYLVSSR